MSLVISAIHHANNFINMQASLYIHNDNANPQASGDYWAGSHAELQA